MTYKDENVKLERENQILKSSLKMLGKDNERKTLELDRLRSLIRAVARSMDSTDEISTANTKRTKQPQKN